MQKTRLLGILMIAILSIFLVGTVSAYSIWEPKYETYRLGSSAHGNGAYSSVETYEKVVVENEDRFGSEKLTTVKKTESETYTPSRSIDYSYRYDYDSDYYGGRYGYRYDNDYGYRYSDSYGYGRTVYPESNWRYKQVYHNYDYPNENEYGYDYYYAPRYDWHQEIFNWRY